VNCHLEHGHTIVVSKDDYEAQYRAKISDKSHKDSCYGLCARALVEAIMLETRAAYGTEARVNFVFENNGFYEDARRIFTDFKSHIPEIAANMGTIRSAEKHEFPGLQAADIIASLGRRAEPNAKFEVSPGIGSSKIARPHGNIPLFHIPLNGDRLPGFREQTERISAEKRWAKRKRGFIKRAARQG
jgi:hypothetical protein